jgi:hypothetical protein
MPPPGFLQNSEPMELTDHINAVVALGLAGDLAEASREFEVALARADERAVRRAPPETLVIVLDLSERLGVPQDRERLLALASDLLPASASASIRR